MKSRTRETDRPQQWGGAMVTVRSGEVELYLESTGEGYPIVFVHEFGSDCREWEQQVRWFSRSYRCITYNARGYPPSAVPESPDHYGWEPTVADLLAVLDGLGLPRAHLVGLSMGGYAVLQFARLYPGRAGAVVAAGAGSGSDPDPASRAEWQRTCEATSRGFLTHGMVAMADILGNGPTRTQLKHKSPRAWQEWMDHLAEHSPLGMANTMVYQALRPSLHDFQAEWANVAAPVLLAVGDEDEPCLETNLMLKRCLPNSGLWIHPHTGHAINLEEPAAFNAAVESLLAGVGRLT